MLLFVASAYSVANAIVVQSASPQTLLYLSCLPFAVGCFAVVLHFTSREKPHPISLILFLAFLAGAFLLNKHLLDHAA